MIPSALYAQIEDLGMRDEGTGSTFMALERRKLIQCRSDLDVQLTAWGRRVVRAGTGDIPSRPAKHVLKDWAWKQLVRLYLAGEEGVEKDTFGLRTLDYLDDRGLIIRGASLQISAKGREHDEAQWRMYREIYPHLTEMRQGPVYINNSILTTKASEPSGSVRGVATGEGFIAGSGETDAIMLVLRATTYFSEHLRLMGIDAVLWVELRVGMWRWKMESDPNSRQLTEIGLIDMAVAVSTDNQSGLRRSRHLFSHYAPMLVFQLKRAGTFYR